jgi:hypothetical protein
MSNSNVQSSKSYKMWWSILLIDCIIISIFGVLIYISELIPNSRGLLSSIDLDYCGKDPQAHSFISFIVAVLGATIIGWGTTILFLVWYPLKKKEKWAWYAMAITILLWYIPDTIVSIYFLMLPNVILNTIILLMIELPLFGLKFTKELL